MGERTSYEPGAFCWVDLTTTDQEGAKRFYSGLFGWEAEDIPVGDGGMTYSMQRVRGKDVAAIAPQPAQQREAGMPAVWNNFVAVVSADDAAAKAPSLGATVHAPPFDVMDAGRMAVIQDPQGAFFMVWEARSNIGAGLVNEPGALCWNELASPDLDASASFYGDLFGWSVEPAEGAPSRYLMISNGERRNGGIRETMGDEPPNWSPYFAVEDVEAGLAKAEELGGVTLMDATDMGPATVAAVQDPQSAVFQLYAGMLQP
jgi:predicted enzyme related to lactoylglutathione lyase